MTSSICDGKTLTPLIISMSSLRPVMRESRLCVLPHWQGPGIIFARSRVRYRRSGVPDHLAVFAVRNRLQRVGVDNLDYVGILPDVHSLLIDAFEGDAGAVHFAEAIGVVGVYLPEVLYLEPDILRVRLGAYEGLLEGKVFDAYIAFAEHRMDVEQVTGRGVNDGGLEILHYLDLASGHAAADGYYRHADKFRPVVKAQAAGEKTVGHHVLEYVAGGCAGGNDAPGHEVGPAGDILLCKIYHRRYAGCSAGKMDADDILHVGREQSFGETLPEVILDGKRNAFQVGEALDVVGRVYAGLRKLPLVEIGLECGAKNLPQFSGLQRFQFAPRQGFHLPVPEGYVHLIAP
jgi:hypothetical protein